jgi:hypothetical protein
MPKNTFSFESSDDPYLRRRVAEKQITSLESLPPLHAPANSQAPWNAIKGKIQFHCPSDEVAVQAQGIYALQADTNPCLLGDSISGVREKLEPSGFIRNHHSLFWHGPFGELSLTLPGGPHA